MGLNHKALEINVSSKAISFSQWSQRKHSGFEFLVSPCAQDGKKTCKCNKYIPDRSKNKRQKLQGFKYTNSRPFQAFNYGLEITESSWRFMLSYYEKINHRLGDTVKLPALRLYSIHITKEVFNIVLFAINTLPSQLLFDLRKWIPKHSCQAAGSCSFTVTPHPCPSRTGTLPVRWLEKRLAQKNLQINYLGWLCHWWLLGHTNSKGRIWNSLFSKSTLTGAKTTWASSLN